MDATVLFVMGMAAGGLIATAICYWLLEPDPIPEWEDLLTQQQGHIAELRAISEQPRAVTRLTHRERTVEL